MKKVAIGLFAGAFSPVHFGHVRMVESLLEKQRVARIIIVPASDAYQKPGLMPAAQRIKLLEEAFSSYKEVTISTIDVEQDTFPDSFETAIEAEKRYLSAHEELIWIMGGDRLSWIATHTDLTHVISRYPLIVFDRLPFDKETLSQIPSVVELLNRIEFWNAVGSISSSEVRNKNQDNL